MRAAVLFLILYIVIGFPCQSCIKTIQETPQVILPSEESENVDSARRHSPDKNNSGDGHNALTSRAKLSAPRSRSHRNTNPHWIKAKQIVYAKVKKSSNAHLQTYSRFDIDRATLNYGNYKLKEIALTFDDGPHRKYTPQILKVLKRYKVKATFFVVGKMAEVNDDLLITQYRDHHLIANHTYHHVDLTRLSEKEAQVEWVACNEVARSILGIDLKYCRPPGGNYDDTVRRAALKSGLVTVLWTEDPGDYTSPGTIAIESRIFYSIYNGGIILLHDGVQQTINVLPAIIERLQKEGYTFVTVDEMYRKRKK